MRLDDLLEADFYNGFRLVPLRMISKLFDPSVNKIYKIFGMNSSKKSTEPMIPCKRREVKFLLPWEIDDLHNDFTDVEGQQ